MVVESGAYTAPFTLPFSVPILFYKPLSSMVGPNAPIFVPKVAQPVDVHLSDYEVELTIIIGKTAKNVSEAEALDYILGYTAANDVGICSPRLGFSRRCRRRTLLNSLSRTFRFPSANTR